MELVVSERLLLTILFTIVAAPLPLLVVFLNGSWELVTAAAVVLALLVVVLLEWLRGGSDKPINFATLGLAFAAALTLCVLGGQGHFLYANWDWITRNAVLSDLVLQPWPVVYRAADVDWLLRAPLGMYLVPAFVGKRLGVAAADYALLVQNVLALSIIFYFLPSYLSNLREKALVILAFVFFSGWDIVGALLAYATTGHPLGDHLEWWARDFQYSSAITQIFWVPNHAIAGWSFVVAYLCWARGRASASAGFTLAMVPIISFWSPLAAIGAVPFAAYLGLRTLIDRRIGILDVVQVALAIAAVIPMLVYTAIAAGAVPHGFVSWTPVIALKYVTFIALEVAPFVMLILWARPNYVKDPTFLLAVALLALLPFYRVGMLNDFVMRVSIPALAFIAVILAQIGSETILRGKRSYWLAAALATMVIGSVTGLLEIRRAFRHPVAPLSPCNMIQVTSGDHPEQKLAHYLAPMDRVPAWLSISSAPAFATEPTAACPKID